MARIDVENSIAQERFVYKETVLQMLGRLFSTYFTTVGTLVIFCPLASITLSTSNVAAGMILLLVPTALILISAYLIDKIYFITVPVATIDIKLLEKYLLTTYKKIIVNTSGSKMLLATTSHAFWAYKRVFTAVYDGNKIGLNFFVLGKGDAKYCLFALRNYFICKKILKKVYLDEQTINSP
jgi:hypothetical protein